jgi:uncharacterized protein (TIGR03067 family)
MRYKISLIAVAALLLWSVGPSFAAEIQGAEAQKDLKKFQGAWVMVSGEMDGKKVPDEHVKKSKIKYHGTKVELVLPNQSSETMFSDIVKIDTTKNPREVHKFRKNGPHTGKTVVAIYEFEGDDQYKIAFDPAGKTKLKEFATKEGTGHVWNTWKRVKQ